MAPVVRDLAPQVAAEIGQRVKLRKLRSRLEEAREHRGVDRSGDAPVAPLVRLDAAVAKIVHPHPFDTKSGGSRVLCESGASPSCCFGAVTNRLPVLHENRAAER